jgi:lysophospholipase L1-like esterase
MKSFKRACVLALMLLSMACAGNPVSGAPQAQKAKPQPKLMLNVGDSITQGFWVDGDYTFRLNDDMGWDKWVIFKAGRSGAAISHLNARFWPTTAQGVVSMKTQPDLVTIMLGTNDARRDFPKHPKWADVEPTFVQDAVALIKAFKAMPSRPEIFLVTPPPASDDNRHGIIGSMIRDDVTPRLLKVADQEQVGVIDVWNTELLQNTGDGKVDPQKGTLPTDLYQDGVHPNKAGYKVIADKMAKILKAPRPVIQAEGRQLTCSIHAAAYQWFRDGKKIPADYGGQARDLVAMEDGEYVVAITLDKATLDRLVSAPARVK